MKNPLDYTLGEIETLALLQRDVEAITHCDSIRCFIKQAQEEQYKYRVQAAVKVVSEKAAPVQKRVVSVDADLLNHCVLVPNDLTSEQVPQNN